MKLTVSGWPGGGSSTLSLILCKMLNIKHVRGGETFRAIYKALDKSDTGHEHLAAHRFVEEYFGPLYDEYVDKKLSGNDTDNYLIETDIGAFRVGKRDDLLSIFLLTDEKIRQERLGGDGRSDDGEIVSEIDRNHAETYYKLHGIEWFNEQQIRSTHALVIDNSQMTIADELVAVFDALERMEMITKERASELRCMAQAEEATFWDSGKKYYSDYLKEEELVMSPVEILVEMRQIFQDEINGFPSELKTAIYGLTPVSGLK
jgi:cytidylate kinase